MEKPNGKKWVGQKNGLIRNKKHAKQKLLAIPFFEGGSRFFSRKHVSQVLWERTRTRKREIAPRYCVHVSLSFMLFNFPKILPPQNPVCIYKVSPYLL